MEQQRAITALEPYLALSKNARTPAAAADLIIQATADPSTYVFAELLQTPQIQALRDDPSHIKHLTLLEIFAWGTWRSYKSTEGLPTLTVAQTKKLHLLSLTSLISAPTRTGPGGSGNENLSYTYLQRELEMEDQAELESLLTSALSTGLLKGHLDPLNKRAQITAVASLRDVAPGSASAMVSMLEEWDGRCNETIEDLEARIQEIRDNAKKRCERAQLQKHGFERALTNLQEEDDSKSKGTAKRKEPGKGDAEAMDTDETDGKGLKLGAKSAKKFLAKGLRK